MRCVTTHLLLVGALPCLFHSYFIQWKGWRTVVPHPLSLVVLGTSRTHRLTVLQATTTISGHCFFNLSSIYHFMKTYMLLPLPDVMGSALCFPIRRGAVAHSCRGSWAGLGEHDGHSWLRDPAPRRRSGRSCRLLRAQGSSSSRQPVTVLGWGHTPVVSGPPSRSAA